MKYKHLYLIIKYYIWIIQVEPPVVANLQNNNFEEGIRTLLALSCSHFY